MLVGDEVNIRPQKIAYSRVKISSWFFWEFSCNFVKISIVDFIEAFLSNQFLILMRKKLLLFAM